VVGPIAHSIADMRYFTKAVLSALPWFQDPKVIELPWRPEHEEQVQGRKLTFGLMKWDSLIMPHPPVQRGIKIVEEALRSQGHEIIDFEVPDAKEADRIVVLHSLPFEQVS